jgi:hypothetical protein
MSIYSKHFTYSTETEIDLDWKWELQQVDALEKSHGIKLHHDRAAGMWYDLHGGFKIVRPESNAFRAGVNWNKGKSSGWKGGKGFDVGKDLSSWVC